MNVEDTHIHNGNHQFGNTDNDHNHNNDYVRPGDDNNCDCNCRNDDKHFNHHHCDFHKHHDCYPTSKPFIPKFPFCPPPIHENVPCKEGDMINVFIADTAHILDKGFNKFQSEINRYLINKYNSIDLDSLWGKILGLIEDTRRTILHVISKNIKDHFYELDKSLECTIKKDLDKALNERLWKVIERKIDEYINVTLWEELRIEIEQNIKDTFDNEYWNKIIQKIKELIREQVLDKIGQQNGIAGLDENGKLPTSQLPDLKTINNQSIIGKGNIDITTVDNAKNADNAKKADSASNASSADVAKKVANKLTFTGAVSASYDGSSAVTVNIPVSQSTPGYTLPEVLQKLAAALTANSDGSFTLNANFTANNFFKSAAQ